MTVMEGKGRAGTGAGPWGSPGAEPHCAGPRIPSPAAGAQGLPDAGSCCDATAIIRAEGGAGLGSAC